MQKVALQEKVWKELEYYYHNVEKVQQILLRYAGYASRGWRTPGGTLTIIAQPPIHLSIIANIIMYIRANEAMYKELCKTLGISLPTSTMKKLAHVALCKANPTGQSYIGWSLRCSISVYLSGLLFLEVLLKQARKSANPHEFSDVDGIEMKKALAEIDLTGEDFQKAKEAIENWQGAEKS